jgi:chromosome segregation ATPase
MAFRANQQLRDDIWDYRYKSSPAEPPVESEKIVSFPPSPSRDYGTTALNLVQQAADIFGDMENQAREAEARAQSMYKNLTDKLQQAEMQRDASERARREIVNELNYKIRDVTRALQAAEFRAQAAENELYKANRELAAVEDAIRKRLL